MAFEGLSEKLNGVFKRLKSRGKLSEADVKEAMREVKMALLEADVSYKVVKDFIAKVTERSVGEEVLKSLTPGQQVIKIVNDELIKLMGEANSKINFPNKPPCIIMMCGLQGSGKTTHAAKLAKMFKKEGKRPLLIAADVYRPAAIEQLKVVGERAEVAVFEMGQIDPRKIVKEGIKHAKDYGNDLVIIDTAGRLHIDEELMNELKDIKKIAEPNEIMLVVDAMIGQDAVKVASSFDEALGIDSVILTKLDSDTRGGAALSVLAVTGKPIKFVGMGEKLDEFEAFHPERMASRILGMGDMLTLIEKATQTVDEKDAKKLAEKMQEKGFDLNDLLEQMKQIFDGVNHPNFKVMIDLTAMSVAGESIQDWFDVFGKENIAHAHFQDCNPYGHYIWGEGTRNLQKDLEVMIRNGYEGYYPQELTDPAYYFDPFRYDKRNVQNLRMYMQ